MMKLVNTSPTNGIYEKAQEKWGVDFDKGVMFAYGDTIYAKDLMPADCMVHEEFHLSQQARLPGGAEEWWERYFTDESFRLEQEVEAYQEQYQYAVKNYPRPKRREVLKRITKDLSGPMYGKIITKAEARDLIKHD